MTSPIKSTKNYAMFKKHDSNRTLNPPSLERLKKSIQSNNLLMLRPILVDENMKVIDGQHRLNVAEQLGVPIYYIINPAATVGDIVLLNNQKAWEVQDYLNFYCSEENSHYLRFKNFSEKHNLSLRAALRLLTPSSAKSAENFRAGNFRFPEGEALAELMVKIHQIEVITDYILTKTIGNSVAVKTTHYIYSLILMLNIKSLDFDTFMRKLALALDMFRPCTKILSYLEMWRQIYNYKNKSNAISVDEIPYH